LERIQHRGKLARAIKGLRDIPDILHICRPNAQKGEEKPERVREKAIVGQVEALIGMSSEAASLGTRVVMPDREYSFSSVSFRPQPSRTPRTVISIEAQIEIPKSISLNADLNADGLGEPVPVHLALSEFIPLEYVEKSPNGLRKGSWCI